MSLEGKEPDPPWTDAMDPTWDEDEFDDEDMAVDQEEEEELEEFPPPPDTSVDIGHPFHTGRPRIVESNATVLSTPVSARLDILEYVRQYLWLVGVPLLFGGCTCLIVLPLVALQRTAAPEVALWPITFVIIIIAVAQGFAL